MTRSAYGKLTICSLAFTLAVIVWGAFVRVTGSGAGCGSHWPTCNGEVVPRSSSTATLIEFTHRITSSLALLFVVVVLVLPVLALVCRTHTTELLLMVPAADVYDAPQLAAPPAAIEYSPPKIEMGVTVPRPVMRTRLETTLVLIAILLAGKKAIWSGVMSCEEEKLDTEPFE